MKYIVYCRKSTDEKDKQVLSIDQQIAELKEFSNREHLEIIDFFVEAKTAKVPGREQFAMLLRRIEKGEAQGIVSWHPDRLARNSIDGGKVIYLLDIGKLLDLKFPSFWFDNTPQGKFMLSIAFGQSKYYVDNLSENVKRGNRHKLRIGIWPSKAPLGYINDSKTKTIQVDTEKAKIVRKAFECFAQGDKSLVSITKLLYRFGITAKNGGPIKIDFVKKMLRNKFYIGIMKYAGEYYQGTHKLFISKALFAVVQKQMPRVEKGKQKKYRFAFRGFMTCGECGASITAETHRKYYKVTNRTVDYIYYRCTKKLKPCTQKYIQEQELAKQVRNIIARVALPKTWGNVWYRWLERDEREEQLLSEGNIAKLKAEATTLDRKLHILLDSYLDQIIDADTYKQKKNEMFEEKLKLQEEISKIQTDGSNWLEPMRELVDSALQCEKIARANNTNEELAFFVKTVGSNFFLTNQQLVPTFNQGFATVFLEFGTQPSLRDLPSKSFSVGPRGVEPLTFTMSM